MTKQTEALKIAIEALEQACGLTPRDAHFCKAIQACKDALAQPLTRDWKETIDERIAKDDAFEQALKEKNYAN